MGNEHRAQPRSQGLSSLPPLSTMEVEKRREERGEALGTRLHRVQCANISKRDPGMWNALLSMTLCDKDEMKKFRRKHKVFLIVFNSGRGTSSHFG